ncbi:MAG: hypothetical protein IJB79_00685 [Candidatus Gastranaerophilales bacterium]|nr:hypothetical protein [Candidatus Gastranaerophilales bacterium]
MSASPFQKAYEFEEKYGIDRLKLCIQNAEIAYKTFAPETIDYCKCIIESVAKQIIADNNIEYDKEWTLAQLTKKSIDCLNFENQHIRKALTNIIETYSTVRNQQGIAAHGHIENGTIPTETDVRIFASAFFHYIEIISALLDKSKINTNYTNIKFEKIDEVPEYNYANKYIDNNVRVSYEDGSIFINGQEIRPSSILYNFDRLAYGEMNNECFDNLNKSRDYLEELVLEYYLESFIDENPLLIEDSLYISIDENMTFKDTFIYAKGTLNWEEVEYDENSDLPLKASCTSWFEVCFSYEFDSSINEFSYNIESFEFINY